MTFQWTDESISTAKKLWEEGCSASVIAQHLGGVSRNAVMGKIHRLNLATRPQVEKKVAIERAKPLVCTARLPKAKIDPAKVAQVKKLVERTAALPAPKPLNVTLLDLNHNDCRWPVSGEGAGMLFCGHNVEVGKSYCECHARMSVGRGTISERRADSIGRAA